MSDAARPCPARRLLLAFVAGAAALGVALAVGGLAIVELGLYDVTATTQHTALTAWAVHTTFLHSTARATRNDVSPSSFSRAQVEQGLKLYVRRCEICHGGPATPRADWAIGVNPPPPYLLDASRRFTTAQLHRVIAQGVKLTAMPAWQYTLSDAQVWDVVAFLESLPSTPPAMYLQARRQAQAAGAPAP